MTPTGGALPGPAVSVAWLARNLGRPGLVVLDGSWYLPDAGRDPRAEHRGERVPGARFFGVDECSHPESDLPHTVPDPSRFAQCAEGVGIANDTNVVVYDGSGVNLSAPRVWWIFRYFGHNRISVLDGGVKEWVRQGHSTESGEPVRTLEASELFRTTVRPELVRDSGDILAIVESQSAHSESAGSRHPQIVDMRSAGRFEGTAPEPRAGLRGGHIPGSRNIPFGDLVDPVTGLSISEEKLKTLLSSAGVRLGGSLVGTCGSGTSACALAWRLAQLGRDDVAIYDGSWAEWGGRDDLPISTGPPGGGR